MATDDMFPTEMPDDLPPPTDPLDDDTAERLLSGRLAPEDTPPSYAEVARVLRAAAAPATPRELAGHPAALAAFRTARRAGPGRGSARVPGRGSARVPGRGSARVPGRGRALTPGRARPGRGRARVVALALAGTLAVGGLWMAAGAQTAPGLRSPTGGPGGGGSGSGTSGLQRPATPTTPPTGATPGAGVGSGSATTSRAPGAPSDRDSATAHRGTGAHPAHPAKPPKPKPKPKKPKKHKTPPGQGSGVAHRAPATQRP